jgi:hypothetical protein
MPDLQESVLLSHDKAMEIPPGEGNGPADSINLDDGGSGLRAAGIQSPEEIARNFIRDGGVIDFDERIDPQEVRRKRWFVGGAIVVVIVIAIAAVIALTHQKGSKSPSSGVSAIQTTTTVVNRTTTTTTTTTAPSLVKSAVLVQVLNASPTNGLAGTTGTALTQAGFTVSSVGNAPQKIATGSPSEIFYGPTGLPAAHLLALSLTGPVTFVANPALTGNNVTLWIANSQLTVSTTSTSATTTTTSVP